MVINCLHKLEWSELYKQYEALVERAMCDFAATESMEVMAAQAPRCTKSGACPEPLSLSASQPAELYDMIQERIEANDTRLSKFTGTWRGDGCGRTDLPLTPVAMITSADMLVAAGSYSKFVQVMRGKAKARSRRQPRAS
jgi:hypothetical protein